MRQRPKSSPAHSAIRRSKALPSSVTANSSAGPVGEIAGAGEAARLEDQLAGELGQAGAGDAFEGDAEEDVAEIAVLEARPGRCRQPEPADRPHDLGGALGAGVHRAPAGDPGGVGEQPAHRDALAAELVELREQRRHLLVERAAAAVDECQRDRRHRRAAWSARRGRTRCPAPSAACRGRRSPTRTPRAARTSPRWRTSATAPGTTPVVDRGADDGGAARRSDAAAQPEASVTSRSELSEPVGMGHEALDARATGPGSGSPGTATPTATPRAGSARSRGRSAPAPRGRSRPDPGRTARRAPARSARRRSRSWRRR